MLEGGDHRGVSPEARVKSGAGRASWTEWASSWWPWEQRWDPELSPELKGQQCGWRPSSHGSVWHSLQVAQVPCLECMLRGMGDTCGHFLSRPSSFAAVVFVQSHCQLRDSLSFCGSDYCRFHWQIGPRGCSVVHDAECLSLWPDESLLAGWWRARVYCALLGLSVLWFDSILYIRLTLISGY